MRKGVYQERKEPGILNDLENVNVEALKLFSPEAQVAFMHLGHFQELIQSEDRYVDAAKVTLMREYLRNMTAGGINLFLSGLDIEAISALRQVMGFLLSAASDIFEHDRKEGFLAGMITTGNWIKRLFGIIEKLNEILGSDDGNIKRLQQMSANFAALYAKQLPKQ